MEKTWKPTTAGILSIIAGVPATIGGIVIAVVGGSVVALGAILWAEIIPGIETIPGMPVILGTVAIILGVLTIPLIALGIVAILGGIYALKRRKWYLALAGAICSLICTIPLQSAIILGILAIIFVTIGKGEFE